MLKFLKIGIVALMCVIHLQTHAGTERPVHVPEDIWEQLTPFFVPDNHPIKEKLDKFFSKPNLLQSSEALKKAGFKSSGTRGFSKTQIFKHKRLKNYLIKAFTDDQIEIVDWEIWMRRINGALTINAAIERNGVQAYFKVPQKWIYQIPRTEQTFETKNFVLVVEDMQLYDQRGNSIMWNGMKFVTKEKLNALYKIISEEGLLDSIYIDNIPFSKIDDKIAFIDTEHFHKWPVPFHRLTPFLAKKMQVHWMSLISNNP
jgi:hypothetical protein